MTVNQSPAGSQATAWLLATATFCLGILLGRPPDEAAQVIGLVERVVVAEGGLGFTARIDTGAAVSSVHATDIVIVGGNPDDPPSNKGRLARFTLVNEDGARVRLEAPIERVQRVRTGPCREYRYHVYLTVSFRGRSTRLLVNLNDRAYAREKLLLGRNWLDQGFVIDTRRTL